MEALLNPVVLLALLVLVVNDHFLKEQWGNTLTGKLSDVAGLVFFPIVCVAIADAALRVGGRSGVHRSGFVAALIVIGIAFTAVKVSPTVAEGYSYGLGAMQWPIESTRAALSGSASPTINPVWVLADATDVLALPALWQAWRVGRGLFV
jgi:hypothetical protein